MRLAAPTSHRNACKQPKPAQRGRRATPALRATSGFHAWLWTVRVANAVRVALVVCRGGSVGGEPCPPARPPRGRCHTRARRRPRLLRAGGRPPPSHSPADMPNAWAITDSEAESDGGRQAPRLRGRPPVSLGGVPLTALRLARSNRPRDRAPSSPRRSACGPGSASAGMTLRGGGGDLRAVARRGVAAPHESGSGTVMG